MTVKFSSLAVGLMALTWSLPAWSQTAPATQSQPQPQPQQATPAPRSPFRSAGDRRFDDGMRQPRTEWRRGDVRPEFPSGRTGSGSGGGTGGGGREVEQQQDYDEPTAEEWTDIEDFMKKYSPKRLERMADIADDDRQQSVKKMLTIRYRTLQELKDQDEQLYKIRRDRMLIEDDVFALGWELRSARSEKPEEGRGVEKIRAELREKLRLLMKSGLQERAHRLKHWEKVLEQHREKLKEDEERVDSAVERYMLDVQEERWPRFLRPLPPQRRQRSEGDAADELGERGDGLSPRREEKVGE